MLGITAVQKLLILFSPHCQKKNPIDFKLIFLLPKLQVRLEFTAVLPAVFSTASGGEISCEVGWHWSVYNHYYMVQGAVSWRDGKISYSHARDESTWGQEGTLSGYCSAFLLGAHFLPEGHLDIYAGRIPCYFRNLGFLLMPLVSFLSFVLKAALCSLWRREGMFSGFPSLTQGIPNSNPNPGERLESPEPVRKIY